ncbi:MULTISPECIES: hypothetical protein [unclassified Amycolatopsis]|uniref:hypothetical protein n=1 Tax=unclassified Amycolatopsis TaxID=2618356 RepID=UPI00106E67B1|nr:MULTISPECIES: hypothetical protein [unclassified Amycolatopsis]
MSERKPTPNELCDCGRLAVTVYVFDGRETPYCGIPDGGADAEAPGRVAETTRAGNEMNVSEKRFDDSDGVLVTVYSVPGEAEPLPSVLAVHRDSCTRVYADPVFHDRADWPEGTRKTFVKVFDGCPAVEHECMTCPRGHGADALVVRPSGARICTDCQSEFTSNANASRRINARNRATRKATKNDQRTS